VKLPHYDIVRRENGRKLLWLEDTADLEKAKTRIQELASYWPGEFEVMDQQSHQAIAKSIGPSEELSRKPPQ
jgi:hypothetical protein